MNNNSMNNGTINSGTNTGMYNTTTSGQMNNTTSTSNYNAYGIPNYVQMNFQTQHPNVSNLTWDQSTADWYHGYYSDATTGRYTHVYYSTDPYYNVQYYPERVTGYIVALPVLETWVPDEVVTAALNQYKQNLYDISAMKGNNSQDIYVARVRDNGELKSVWIDANGAVVTDYLRTEEQANMNNTTNVNNATSTDTNSAMDNNSSMNNSSMNNSSMNSSDANNMNTDAKVKTKTKMADGSEIKTKTKDGKTKTKISGSTTNSDNTQL